MNGTLEGARLANNPEAGSHLSCFRTGKEASKAGRNEAMQGVIEGKSIGTTVCRTPEAVARNLGFIQNEMESSGGKRCLYCHPSQRKRSVGQGSLEIAAPVLTSFLAGAAQKGPGVVV